MSQNELQKPAIFKALNFLLLALLLNSTAISPLNCAGAQSVSQPQASAKAAAKPATSSSTTKKKTKKHVATKREPRGQREIEPSRVMEIQNALATAGYYREQPSGKWDPSTAEAMSAYQESNGFKVTGKPDALSLKRLGL
jgi:peptidoglycan hydrolase-like protein with peptidoglycan-binding domain